MVKGSGVDEATIDLLYYSYMYGPSILLFFAIGIMMNTWGQRDQDFNVLLFFLYLLLLPHTFVSWMFLII